MARIEFEMTEAQLAQLRPQPSAQALDPNKVQICRVAPIAYANGQPCACPEGTCNLWKGGLRPSAQAAEPGWFLPREVVNDIQADSIERLIQRARGAHYADVDLRINGQNEHYQADWLKHLIFQPSAQACPVVPRSPQDIRSFIGVHFNSRVDAKPAPDDGVVRSSYEGEASEDDVYTLSVHDLLSAFEEWFAASAAQACPVAAQAQTAEQAWKDYARRSAIEDEFGAPWDKVQWHTAYHSFLAGFAASAPVAAISELHRDIMNLPCEPPYEDDRHPLWLSGYRIGHRDARHAAAELVCAALSKHGSKK